MKLESLEMRHRHIDISPFIAAESVALIHPAREFLSLPDIEFQEISEADDGIV